MNDSVMLGTWEFLIISVVVSFVVLPYFRKRAQQKRRSHRSASQAPATKKEAYRPPAAKSVPYEVDDEASS
jgi:large-conductance mechanosensitive channel